MDPKVGYILVGSIIKPVSQTNAVIIDGAIAVGMHTGTIRDFGTLQEISRKYSTWEIIHMDDSVILPAFADAHTHLPQFSIRRSGKARLYDWLEGIVFPEELRFKDINYASQVTYSFFKDMLKNGTLTAMIYMSPFFETITSISQLAEKHSFIDFHAGPILMNTQIPDTFETDTETIIENIEETAVWLKRKFAVSPRYAPLCDAELLCQLGKIVSKHDLFIQLHIAELPDEFQKTKVNFPDAKYYSEIYEDTGLLTDKTVLGHCIYLDNEDYKAITEAKALVAHLPLANEALGSGRMPLEKLREFGVNWALGTDVGASPTLSMLAVMQSFVRTHKDITPATAVEALYRSTRSLPEFLGKPFVGQIEPGSPANLVIVNSKEAARQNDAEKALRLLTDGSFEELEAKVTATIAKGNIVSGSIPSLIP